MKPDFAAAASARIQSAVNAPQVPKAKMPSKPVKVNNSPVPPSVTPATVASKPGNRYGTLKSPGTKATPKPFQPGFTAGKSGKVPSGLAKAASNRMKMKRSSMVTGRRGVKWLGKRAK